MSTPENSGSETSFRDIFNVTGILESEGIQVDPSVVEYWHSMGDHNSIKGFFEETETSAGSKFGRYAQLRIGEAQTVQSLQRILRRNMDGSGEIRQRAKPQVDKVKSFLDLLRDKRKEVGQQIFGDEEPHYAQQVLSVIRGLEGRTDRQRASRAQARIALATDVRIRFPLTSR